VRGNVLHVLLLDKGKRTARFDLHLPAGGPATVQRLLAPSPYSRSGVTLDGQRLNAAGYWVGAPTTETVTRGPGGGYVITLPRRSAALVAVRLGSARRVGSSGRLGLSGPKPAVSEHHGRVAVSKHAVLAVRLHRSRKH
jgi:Glycosyl hydrolase family 79 C-terminal beta domain